MGKNIIDRISNLRLSNKQYNEMKFWRGMIKKYIEWYLGKIDTLYGVAAPNEDVKVTGYDLKENAIRTVIKVNINKYPEHLAISPDYFRGQKVLDIGCGPNPWVTGFTDCQAYGLDELIDVYKKLGFPLDSYSARLTYFKGGAENIPVEDNFFDAVISVNAIDHVKDFPAAAKEITRVLKPNGIIRMEVHQHKPTVCEPWSLDDEIVLECFGHLKIKKISERSWNANNPDGLKEGEKMSIWGNSD